MIAGLLRFAVVVAILSSLWNAIHVGSRQVSWPLDLSVESAQIHAARALGNREDPWKETRFLAPPYHPVIYPPVWTILTSVLGEDSSNPFSRSRVMAGVCATCAVLVGLLASGWGPTSFLLASSFLLLSPVVQSWVMARPDALASLLLVISLAILIRRGDSRVVADFLCGFLFGLALATKQTALWFLPALAHRGQPRSLLFRSAGMLTGFCLALAGARLLGAGIGNVLNAMAWVHAPLDFSLLVFPLKSMIAEKSLLAVVALLLFVAIRLSIHPRWRWIGVALIVGVASSVVGWARPGGAFNYLIDPIWIGGIVIVEAGVVARRWLLPSLIGLVMLCLIETIPSGLVREGLAPASRLDEALAARRRVSEVCADSSRLVLDLGILSTPMASGCDRTEVNDLVLNMTIWADHPEGGESMVRSIRTGRYDLIVFAEGNPFLKRIDRSAWMPKLSQAIMEAGYCPSERILGGWMLSRCASR